MAVGVSINEIPVNLLPITVAGTGGFLLLVDGVSFLLLVDGVSLLALSGTPPVTYAAIPANVSVYEIGI